jgi:hypothetical protein
MGIVGILVTIGTGLFFSIAYVAVISSGTGELSRIAAMGTPKPPTSPPGDGTLCAPHHRLSRLPTLERLCLALCQQRHTIATTHRSERLLC